MNPFQKILEFMSPSIAKTRVINQCTQLKTTIHKNLIPIAHTAATQYGHKPLVAKSNQDIDLALKQGKLKQKYSGNVLALLEMAVKQAYAQAEILEGFAKTRLKEDLVRDHLNAIDFNVTNYIAQLDQTCQYLGVMLDVMITDELLASNISVSEPSPADRQNMATAYAELPQRLEWLARDPNELLSLFSQVPDVSITPDNMATLQATVGDGALDPLRMGFIGTSWNPIYNTRIRWAEFQVERLREDEALAETIELKLLGLRQAERNEGLTPQLQKKLEIQSARLSQLRASIEERYNAWS